MADDLGRFFKRAADAARKVGKDLKETVTDEERQQKLGEDVKRFAGKAEGTLKDIAEDVEEGARKFAASPEVTGAVEDLGDAFKRLADTLRSADDEPLADADEVDGGEGVDVDADASDPADEGTIVDEAEEPAPADEPDEGAPKRSRDL